MIDQNVTSVGDMVPTSIRNRTRKHLVIEDPDDNSTPSPVPPVAVASTAIAPLAATSLATITSPAAFGSPTNNLAPTPAISGTINLPRAPAVSTESTGATRPHNVDAEMVDEPLHGSRVCGWPDPEGKTTAAQIRPILRENGIHYKMADSKAVLLAKYKLLFSNRQGNTPRCDLRQRDLAEINSSTAILNPRSAEVPSAAAPNVPAGEPSPINISHSTHNHVQPNLPCPESQPNNTHNVPNLIDMEASSAMSVHPLSPNIARPTKTLRLASVMSVRRPEPADPDSCQPEPAVPVSLRPDLAVPGFCRPEPAGLLAVPRCGDATMKFEVGWSAVEMLLHLWKLKNWCLEEVVRHPSLVGLIPVIKNCCSDDETDE
ncbi:hypothetical protein PCASD_06146 [Puccinia coronata f. sp. avenae]|uniref:Uncharacterized protein n=1 Tax=Puccinia coronata f. sp. avenae TaxID=200324 RepID=A0A2N5V0A8_9BASI|nr:hypothetical protein PCASD_06146 [Puccinia coronata f. sp. avenae]